MGIIDCFRKVPENDIFTISSFNCKRNGMDIRGTEYRPEGDNLPVAIVCHGFMAWQDTVRQYTKELARMGYPNAKLHIIEGGTHGFGKKHDAIAIAHLKRFLS